MFGISSEAEVIGASANIYVNNIRFERNFVGIIKKPEFLPSFLQVGLGTKFEGGALLPAFSGATPWPLNGSFAGIVWNKADNGFSLWGIGNVGDPISFKNLHNGVILNNIQNGVGFVGKLLFENIGVINGTPYVGSEYWLAPLNNSGNVQVNTVIGFKSAISTRECGSVTYTGTGPNAPNFINVFNGITSVGDLNFRVEKATFNVVTGTGISHVSSMPSTVDIRNNYINDYYTGHGIQIYSLSQAITGNILRNAITGTDPANPNVKQASRKAIFVSGYNGPTPLKIVDNDITKMHYGIWALNCNGLTATENHIFNENLYNCKAYGVLLENSQYVTATCNEYYGTDAVVVYYPNPPGNTQHFGIYLKTSPNSVMNFNQTYDSEYGIFAKDLNSSSSITYNSMNNHRYGIYIDLNSRIGTQGFSRNSYHGGTFQKHAVDLSLANWQNDPINEGLQLSLSGLLNSTFKYRLNESNTAATLTSPSFLASECTQNDFYQCSYTTDQSWPYMPCKTLAKRIAGPDEKDRENDSLLFDKMAKGELWFSEFEDQYRADARRYLADRIGFLKVTVADTGIYAALYSSLEAGKENQFNEADTLFATVALDTTLVNYLELLSDSIRSKLYDIFVLDSLNGLQLIDPAMYETARQNIWTLIEQIQDDQNIQLQVLYKPEKADAAKLKNETIVTDRLFEQYEMQVNNIFLSSIARSNLSVDQGQLDQLLLIAATCPKIGGTAVFKARSLLMLFVDTLFYDDDSLCFQQGVEYRLAKPDHATLSQPRAILYPNPISDRINIKINEELKGLVTVIISNTVGQQVWKGSISGSEAVIQEGIPGLASGSYVVELTNADGTFHHIGKLIKIK